MELTTTPCIRCRNIVDCYKKEVTTDNGSIEYKTIYCEACPYCLGKKEPPKVD